MEGRSGGLGQEGDTAVGRRIRRLQEHGRSRIQNERDGAAGGDPQVGEGAWCRSPQTRCHETGGIPYGRDGLGCNFFTFQRNFPFVYQEYPIPPINWDYLIICAAGEQEDEVCKMTPVDCM